MSFRAPCVAALLSLGACAPLTAQAPLFMLADQASPAPLREGVWMQTDPACTPETAQRGADGCTRIEVAGGPDGGWLYTMRSTDESGVTEENAWRFVITSAVETERGEEYAPLYVAEYVAIDEPDQPFYAVVAPVGPMPASEVRMVAMIDCDDALREGPIPGVEEVGDKAFERLCIADAVEKVREVFGPSCCVGGFRRSSSPGGSRRPVVRARPRLRPLSGAARRAPLRVSSSSARLLRG